MCRGLNIAKSLLRLLSLLRSLVKADVVLGFGLV